MTKFEQWYLKRIIKREIVRDYYQDSRIYDLYAMIIKECRDQFSDSSKTLLDQYLKRLHNQALGKTFDHVVMRQYRFKILDAKQNDYGEWESWIDCDLEKFTAIQLLINHGYNYEVRELVERVE